VFRGALGKTLRDLTCAFHGKECRECLIRGKCLYAQVFESHNVEGRSLLRKIEKAPHPFIIFVPDNERLEYRESDKIRFYLTLIGSAIEYIAYFILAFEQIGKKGIGLNRSPFKVEQVVAAGENIYDAEGKKVLRAFPVYRGNDFLEAEPRAGQAAAVKITLESPLRLKTEGKVQTEITFEGLVRNLFRRLHLISLYSCGGPDYVDFTHYIERAGRIKSEGSRVSWYNQRRFSMRQEKSISVSGLTGWLRYEGEMGEFMPYLRLGEYLHIGKGTAFGLGKIKVEPIMEL
jgi:hypothetical protein